MDIHDVTEQVYKNGYNKGMEDAVKSGYAHQTNNTVKCVLACQKRIWMAYTRLLNVIYDDDATKMDLRAAISDAIKLLGDTPV